MFNRKRIRENKILIEFIADEIKCIKQELEQMNKDIKSNSDDLILLNKVIHNNSFDIDIIKSNMAIFESKGMNLEKEKQN